MMLDRFLGITERIIAGQDQNHAVLILSADLLDAFQPVHQRHVDIQHQQIRRHFFIAVHDLTAVFRRRDDLNSQIQRFDLAN